MPFKFNALPIQSERIRTPDGIACRRYRVAFDAQYELTKERAHLASIDLEKQNKSYARDRLWRLLYRDIVKELEPLVNEIGLLEHKAQIPHDEESTSSKLVHIIAAIRDINRKQETSNE